VALNLFARKVPRFLILVELEGEASGKAGEDTQIIEICLATQHLLLRKIKNLIVSVYGQAIKLIKVGAKSTLCEQFSKAEYKKHLQGPTKVRYPFHFDHLFQHYLAFFCEGCKAIEADLRYGIQRAGTQIPNPR
jgi:hypothetical protein